MGKLFEYYIETDELHFKYAKGEPAVKGQEFHDYNEFLFFIDNEGKNFFISKNIQKDLAKGSLVFIPKEHFHQFCVETPESYVRCVLGFRETSEISELASEIADAIRVIEVPEERIVCVFENIIEMVKSKLSDNEKAMFIKASLIQLLIYLKQQHSGIISKSIHLSQIVKQAIDMIDEQYAKCLTVESIAQKLYVSPSTLSHKFSKELNISVYKYITKKRLAEANKLIRQGSSATNAAIQSGFSDFSCFYRLYKKYYKEQQSI